MPASDYELWVTKYVCADCDPTLDDENEYEKPYVIMVNLGDPCPLEFCPQCDSYGGFTEMGEFLARHKALGEVVAAPLAEPKAPVPALGVWRTLGFVMWGTLFILFAVIESAMNFVAKVRGK